MAGARKVRTGAAANGVSSQPYDESVVEQIEQAIDGLLTCNTHSWSTMDRATADLRTALDAVRKKDPLALVDVAFGRAMVMAVEVLVRAELSLRAQVAQSNKMQAGEEFPKIDEAARAADQECRGLPDSLTRYSIHNDVVPAPAAPRAADERSVPRFSDSSNVT